MPRKTIKPWSLEGFRDWLAEQPAKATFFYADTSGNCCVGLYLQSLGIPCSYWTDNEKYRQYVETPFGALNYYAAGCNNFGDVLKEVRQVVRKLHVSR